MSVASRAVPVLAAAAVLALGVPMAGLASANPDTAPGGGAPWQVVLPLAAAAGAAAAGAALAARRATAVCGTLLMLAGPAVVIAAVPVAPAHPALLFTIVLAGAALAPALLGAAAVTCPAGPLRRWNRLAVTAALIVAGLVSGLLPATLFDAKASGCFTCAANLAEIHAAPGLRDSLLRWGLVLTVGTSTGLAVLAAWRWRRAPRIVRLVNAPVAVGGAAVALLSAVAAGYALAQPVPVIDAPSRAIWLAQCAIVVLMAGGVAATALRTRRLASHIAAEVLAATPDAAALRSSLAQSIDDPGLTLVFPRDDGTIIDAAGRPVSMAGPAAGAAGPPASAGLAVATVRRASRPVAEVRYRAELAGAEQLLGTAVRSAGLALEHVAAQARLRAELADLAASRRRIIEDADTERRQLERDLHDGAQQRLIGLQLFMQLAADDAPGEQAETYGAARRIVSSALADLRDLAHGIHPAALTDDGLMTGLRTLANRSPVPLTISGAGPVTRSAVAEAAAYRLVAYTAHTAGRLDDAPAIRATVDGDEGTLRIRIEADGIDGTHLAEIMTRASDRIAAAGGSAIVETTETAAARTTITAEFPCAS
jgi:signal transduction histidine kinase